MPPENDDPMRTDPRRPIFTDTDPGSPMHESGEHAIINDSAPTVVDDWRELVSGLKAPRQPTLVAETSETDGLTAARYHGELAPGVRYDTPAVEPTIVIATEPGLRIAVERRLPSSSDLDTEADEPSPAGLPVNYPRRHVLAAIVAGLVVVLLFTMGLLLWRTPVHDRAPAAVPPRPTAPVTVPLASVAPPRPSTVPTLTEASADVSGPTPSVSRPSLPPPPERKPAMKRDKPPVPRRDTPGNSTRDDALENL